MASESSNSKFRTDVPETEYQKYIRFSIKNCLPFYWKGPKI